MLCVWGVYLGICLIGGGVILGVLLMGWCLIMLLGYVVSVIAVV